MEAQLTQCPQCFTSFKVTPAQMQAAKGMVRCGSCLSVFSANANLIRVRDNSPEPEELQEDLLEGLHESPPGQEIKAYNVFGPYRSPEPPPGTSNASAQTTTPSPAPATTDDEEANPARRALEAAAGMPGVNFDYGTAAAPDTHEDPEPDQDSVATNSRLEDGTEEEMPDVDDTPYADEEPFHADDVSLGDLQLDDDLDVVEEDYDEPLAYDNDDYDDLDFAEDDYAEPQTDDDDADHDPDEDEPGAAAFADDTPDDEDDDFMDEDHEDLDQAYHGDDPDPADPDDADEAEDDFELEVALSDDDFNPAEALAEDEDEAPDDDNIVPAPVIQQVDKAALRQYLATIEDEDAEDFSSLDEDSLDALDDEPVTLLQAPHRRRILQTTVLGLLNLALVSALALQYVDQHYLRLAGSARFAPYLPWICRILDCPPTQAEDLASLYSQEFLIRTHPAADNALELSFIFRNDAERDLPFPGLELSLSDDGDQLLANRLFTPDEYLPAELRLFDSMPGKSSIQVRLELQDPGEEAVNYTMAFKPLPLQETTP
jgi:predicted Zn finger-like uncharacterized protein